MNTELTTTDIHNQFCENLMELGVTERQHQVRKLLEELADLTQFTIEEEFYLRALRGMRKR